jgi:hypothetical protein
MAPRPAPAVIVIGGPAINPRDQDFQGDANVTASDVAQDLRARERSITAC